MPRNALGKGLNALIREPEPILGVSGSAPAATESIQQIDVDLIDPSPYQARMRFHEESLEELAQSIRSSGIIQPLVARRNGTRYELIAGERRWRAAQRAGFSKVAAVVREVPPEAALEMTLVENLQREDLNPVEQATAFQRLLSEFHLTQEEVASRTAKDRATIANALRLLKLERPIQDLLEEGKLTAGHGRALLGIADPQLRIALARRAARGGLTVRQLERLATRRSRPPKPPEPPTLDANTRAALDELQRVFATRVRLRQQTPRQPGELIFEYYDDGDLMRIYDALVSRRTT